MLVAPLALTLFCLTNLPWQLDDYDQAKQAFTSFEMVKEGHWLYQRTPHERVATKPPLVGWISTGLYEITRSWDLAWRLPSLGAAVALSILLYRAGNVYGAMGGLIAFSAFAFNLLTPRLASLVRTDMPLALVIAAIGILIWQHIREGRGWSARDRLFLFLLLTTGMLIKGPIVYAFVFPGVLAFVWFNRKTPREQEARGCGWWPWIVPFGIFALWAIGGCLFVPKFYDQVVMREFLGRFGETIHRPQPVWFYLPHLLHKFAPWSLLLIALAIVDFRARKDRQSLSPETLWLICWVLGGLLVMSLIPSKRVDRIFPVIPPLCLLLAGQLRPRFHRWTTITLLLSILYAGGYSAFKVHTGYRDHRDALVEFCRDVKRYATAEHKRIGVVASGDEGLLLYFGQLHFIRPDAVASELFDQRTFDAVVVPIDFKFPNHPETKDAVIDLVPLRSVRLDDRPNYCVIGRAE